MLIYFAYLLLRSSFEDEQRRARISAIYNVFAFSVFIPLIYILPRLTDSLHPGNGGNPAFSSYDLDNAMRLVFYPAVIGWTLLGVWITTLRARLVRIRRGMNERNASYPPTEIAR
jgi:heme exporter protein C